MDRTSARRLAQALVEAADTAADDPAQLYYSSGTTGKAKGILHAHRYLLAHEEFEFCHDVRDGDLFHGSGEWAWAAGICPLLGPWRYGAVALVQARKGGYDPEEHLRFLSKHGVENMFTTPTALRAMTGVEDAGTRFPLDRLRITCSAGEPLNPEVIRWFREQFGVTVLDYYGLTESYPLCGNFPSVEVREGSWAATNPAQQGILGEKSGTLVVGCWRKGAEHPAPWDQAQVLEPGDRLIAIGTPLQVDRLRELLG